MNALKSRTILFNILMAIIESANVGFAVLEPILSTEAFVITTFILGMVHSIGGMYLRMITTQPINEL